MEFGTEFASNSGMTDPLPWPERTDRIILEEVDSTMAEASRRAPDLKRPTWIMARRQTEARGRRGRRWDSAEGNFAATFIFRPEGNAATAALRSFSAATALFEALALKAPRESLALKWPNDVLLNGGKVAGILLESVGTRGAVDWLAIGFGVNLAKAPPSEPGMAFPPVSLEGEGGEPTDPDEMLSLLASNMATEEGLFTEMGFAPIREKWLRHAARLGETITARTARDEVTGVFETVNEAGQLVLRTPRGQVAISAADVFF